MSYTSAEAKRVIRISSGWDTTEVEWNALALALSGLESEFCADNGNVIKI